ncbi:GFA family protein [Teredinibacter purpureus]
MKGSCLCGNVHYEITPPFKMFQYCHCSRCRKFTGSAHAANIFVAPSQFRWLKGQSSIQRFQKPDAKYFATCFCTRCGSSLPWQAQGVPNIVVPAGTLDEELMEQPQQCIFWGSRPAWFVETHNLKKHNALPLKT